MKQYITLLILILIAAACNNKTEQMDQEVIVQPPIAKKVAKELIAHGDTRIDDYYWMRGKENPAVIEHLNVENAYTNAMTAHLEDFQEELFQEIKGRIKEDDQSVPYKYNGYYYITRFEKGMEYPIHSRKKGNLEAEEEILLNVNELAKDYDFYSVSGRTVSPNNQILAYGEDTLSRRIYTLRFKDLQTGEMLEDVIENTTGSAVWANDNKTVFYVTKEPETLRSYKVFRHVLGTPVEEDVEVWHEEDNTFLCYAYKSKSEKYIIIASYQTISQEFRVLEADQPTNEFRVIQPRERNLEYSIAHYGDQFYIRTNLDAKNFRLMSAPETATTKDNWKEIIPHRSDVLLEGMEIFKDYLVLSERKNGIIQLRVRPWEGEEHYIEFEEEAYVAGATQNLEFNTETLRFSYTSMTTPASVFDYNMKEKTRDLLKQQEVIGDFDAANYQSERLYVAARDGAKIPLSMVYRKGFKKDGQQPILLYAYGSYGNSMEPYFSSVRLSLLDRGFAFAIAHIRGGEEMGRQWYEDGKLLNKVNTFNDFIDCGQYLVNQNYTNPDQLFAMGGSAGGLLMGAIMNMRPDLWKGVVAAVPFVDVVTTMLDESIPLTTFEYDEWGNPNQKEYYDYMLSYSPYDNVSKQDYPATLVTTGLHDSQVQYWEPAKWVAKLREYKTGENPILFHINMDAGHGGQSGRYRRFKETALQYAFFLDLAGRIQ
ncbi:MAG: S9 family peptidase [Bacteroidota bacterium]